MECELWSHKWLKHDGSIKGDGQMDIHVGNRKGGGVRWQLLKLPAEWTQYMNEFGPRAFGIPQKAKHAR